MLIYMLAKLGWWIVVACLWFVNFSFLMCIFDRLGLNLCAICVHVVGMWLHMLAMLCWRIVVACMWFVKAGGFKLVI